MARPFLPCLFLPCLFLLALAACASSNPRLHTLALRPGPTRTGAPHVVAVRAFGVPRYLERQEMVRGDGPNRLATSDDDWWAEPLRVMLRRLMVDDLAQRLPAADVMAADGLIAVRPDAEIQVELQRFEWDGAGSVVMAGYVAIDRPGLPRTIERLRISVPGGGASAGDQVDAMSAALAQAADLTAARLAP